MKLVKNRYQRYSNVIVIFAGAGVLLAWEILARAFAVPAFVLPPPSVVGKTLIDSFAYLVHHCAATLLEALIGLVVATIIGLISGALIAISLIVRRVATPYLVAFQAVPIIAVAPVFVLWFGIGLSSKVALAALLCYFPITINFARGLNAVSREQTELFRILGASRWQTLVHLRFPVSVPYVLTGIRIAAASAMLGAIVAEYTGADVGIGYVITQANYRLETPLLFAAVIAAAVLGASFFLLVVAAERLLFFRFAPATQNS